MSDTYNEATTVSYDGDGHGDQVTPRDSVSSPKVTGPAEGLKSLRLSGPQDGPHSLHQTYPGTTSTSASVLESGDHSLHVGSGGEGASGAHGNHPSVGTPPTLEQLFLANLKLQPTGPGVAEATAGGADAPPADMDYGDIGSAAAVGPGSDQAIAEERKEPAGYYVNFITADDVTLLSVISAVEPGWMFHFYLVKHKDYFFTAPADPTAAASTEVGLLAEGSTAASGGGPSALCNDAGPPGVCSSSAMAAATSPMESGGAGGGDGALLETSTASGAMDFSAAGPQLEADAHSTCAPEATLVYLRSSDVFVTIPIRHLGLFLTNYFRWAPDTKPDTSQGSCGIQDSAALFSGGSLFSCSPSTTAAAAAASGPGDGGLSFDPSSAGSYDPMGLGGMATAPAAGYNESPPSAGRPEADPRQPLLSPAELAAWEAVKGVRNFKPSTAGLLELYATELTGSLHQFSFAVSQFQEAAAITRLAPAFRLKLDLEQVKFIHEALVKLDSSGGEVYRAQLASLAKDAMLLLQKARHSGCMFP